MTPEELAIIEAYLAELRAATVKYGQEAFERHDPEEAHRHADRLTELNRADAARIDLVEAIAALRRALAAFPPLPEEASPTPPPALVVSTHDGGNRHAPTPTQLAPDLEGEPIVIRQGSIAATGVHADGRWIVRAGSRASMVKQPSFTGGYVDLREGLIANGTLAQDGEDTYVFTKNVEFSSPSAAAAVVLGRHANGRMEWRRPDGRTLHRTP